MVIKFHNIGKRTEAVFIFFNFVVVVAGYMMKIPAYNTASQLGYKCVVFKNKISQVNQNVIVGYMRIDFPDNMISHFVFIFKIPKTRFPGSPVWSTDIFMQQV